jgi:hypothetical protein
MIAGWGAILPHFSWAPVDTQPLVVDSPRDHDETLRAPGPMYWGCHCAAAGLPALPSPQTSEQESSGPYA